MRSLPVVLALLLPFTALADDAAKLVERVRAFSRSVDGYSLEITSTTQLADGASIWSGTVKGHNGKSLALDHQWRFEPGGPVQMYLLYRAANGVFWRFAKREPFKGAHLVKTRMTDLAVPGRPLDTGTSLPTGLFKGEDYPQTIKSLLSIYRWSASKAAAPKGLVAEGQTVSVLKGVVDEAGLRRYIASSNPFLLDRADGFADEVSSYGTCQLYVRSSDGAVLGWTMLSKQGDAAKPLADVRITELRVGLTHPASTFTFPAKQAAAAVDQTEQSAEFWKRRLAKVRAALQALKKK